MVIFERFEDKKFELDSLEAYHKIDTFSLEELEDELEYVQNKMKVETDEKKREDYNRLDSTLRMSIMAKKLPSREELERRHDEMFLPEFRKSGYFNSEEFKAIEKEVDDYLQSLDGVNRYNYEILKEEILRNKYGLNWKPYHRRFMPGVEVIID